MITKIVTGPPNKGENSVWEHLHLIQYFLESIFKYRESVCFCIAAIEDLPVYSYLHFVGINLTKKPRGSLQIILNKSMSKYWHKN